jgi:Holliday junction resolvase RusA-like endonuclease
MEFAQEKGGGLMRLFIHGKPIAKKRPRFARRGKHVVTYNDQETAEGLWILEAKKQIRELGGKALHGPLELTVFFAMPRPKSHFGTGRNAGILKSSAPKAHTQTPDLDNLLKFVMDCLNHCDVWLDDKQVVWIATKKMWSTGDYGGTSINIRKVWEDGE